MVLNVQLIVAAFLRLTIHFRLGRKAIRKVVST